MPIAFPERKISLVNVTKLYYNFNKMADIVLEKYDNLSRIPQVFQKYSKFQHVYPAIFPSRDITKMHDDEIKVEQIPNKQKEIGRDISVNRNVKNTKHVKNSMDVNMSGPVRLSAARKNTGDGNNITNKCPACFVSCMINIACCKLFILPCCTLLILQNI